MDCIDNLLNNAEIPSTEDMLIAEIEKLKSKNYALTSALRRARQELKECRRELNKRIREDRKRKKQRYKNGKRGSKFNG